MALKDILKKIFSPLGSCFFCYMPLYEESGVLEFDTKDGLKEVEICANCVGIMEQMNLGQRDG